MTNGNGNGNGNGSAIVPSQGFNSAVPVSHNMPVYPNLPYPQAPLSVESQQGSANYYIMGQGRAMGPEDANADYALLPAQQYHESALLQINPIMMIQGRATIVTADYNLIANQQYLRAAGDIVGALGRNDQSEVVAARVGVTGEFVASAPTPPNYVAGFLIEWSSQLQTSAPFTMAIQTERFKGKSWQSVDRNVRLRIGGPDNVGSSGGGMIIVPFAQRISANDTCGWTSGGGSTTAAQGGMQKAILQPAWVPPGFASWDTIPAVTVDPNDAPSVSITVPTNIADGFGVLIRYVTAGSPQLAMMREATYYS